MLTTGRRLESYNTGVQTSSYDSPLHNGETLDISPEDAEALHHDRPGAVGRIILLEGGVREEEADQFPGDVGDRQFAERSVLGRVPRRRTFIQADEDHVDGAWLKSTL